MISDSRHGYQGKQFRNNSKHVFNDISPMIDMSHPINDLDRDSKALRHIKRGSAKHNNNVHKLNLRRESDYTLPSDKQCVLPGGLHIPRNYGEYKSNIVNLNDYENHHIGEIYISTLNRISETELNELIRHIRLYGPLSCGYVRQGDMLVPSNLSYRDRARIVEHSKMIENYQLSR